MKATWTFLEVGHGKGSHDWFGGRVECQAYEAVKKNPENMVQDKSDYVKKAKKQEGSSSIKYIKYPTQFIAEEGLELERMPCITIPVPWKLEVDLDQSMCMTQAVSGQNVCT